MAATDQELETQIAQWRDFIGRRREIGADVDELEAHLRDRIEALAASGLSNDEAFLVAVKRLGRIDELSASSRANTRSGCGNSSSSATRARPADATRG